jgi:hypothetical protein
VLKYGQGMPLFRIEDSFARAACHGDRDGDSDWLPWRSQPAGSAIGVTVASGPR